MKVFLMLIALLGTGLSCKAQVGLFDLSSNAWLEDQLTIPFGVGAEKRPILSGIRLLFEPQLSQVFQDNEENKVTAPDIGAIPKLGIETNLYGAWVSVQAILLLPGSTVQFDENSPIRLENLTKLESGKLKVESGYAFGLSLFDGTLGVGYSKLLFDHRGYRDADNSENLTSSDFIYVSFQPVSFVRSLIKRAKGEDAEEPAQPNE